MTTHYKIVGDEMFEYAPACIDGWSGRVDYWSDGIERLGSLLLTDDKARVSCQQCIDYLNEVEGDATSEGYGHS